MDSVSKLNLACGNEYADGHWNVDDCSMYPSIKVDQRDDITKMSWKLDSLDVIRLSHFAMYLRPEAMSRLLVRWKSWLKNGGKIEIETIDVKKVANIVATSNDIEEINTWGLTNLFGNPVTCPHEWGWSPRTLTVALHQAGFSDVKVGKGTKKPGRDFLITAIK